MKYYNELSSITMNYRYNLHYNSYCRKYDMNESLLILIQCTSD